jgi:formamidopyrimidine-DNA glycosylase
MPEYPDIELYLAALRPRLLGQPLLKWQPKDMFVLRSVDPPPSALIGKRVEALERLGKRIVLRFEENLAIIVHLMIAGRFRWADAEKKKPPGGALLVWEFESGWLGLTEAGTKRRAKVYVVRAEDISGHDPGGLEVLDSTVEQFRERLQSRRHTLKRSLTDPTLFSGIGNAYSDEILLRARLSPVRMSTQLKDDEVAQLHSTICEVLLEWRDRLQSEWGAKFPTTVTAFHPGMAAHGKYLQPCPQCGNPIQRIRYAENETNYCPTCQTGGKLLADRSLSRLLKSDWPRSLDELEEHLQKRSRPET